MKVEKEILMEQIPGLYAVGEILLDKELYYAAASENRGGGLYLVHSMTKEISELQGCQGGVMAVLGAAQERAILCIEEFYPVFDSAGAKIVKAELERTGKGWAASRRKTVAEFPMYTGLHSLRRKTEILLRPESSVSTRIVRMTGPLRGVWKSAGTNRRKASRPLNGSGTGFINTMQCLSGKMSRVMTISIMEEAKERL